jgi:S1-C subfamily serine protease
MPLHFLRSHLNTLLRCGVIGATSLALINCAQTGPSAKLEDARTIHLTTLASGKTRLTCETTCLIAWSSASKKIKALHDNKLWEDLAVEVSKIGYASDLTYYYLGRAAAGLGHTDAAKNYYRLGLSQTQHCDGWFSSCEGLEFPSDLRVQLANLSSIKKPAIAAAPRVEQPPLLVTKVLPPPTPVKTGTGFFINSAGYVVTNWHVVENAARISFTNFQQKKYQAQLLAKDPSCDLAILKLSMRTKHWLPIQPSSSAIRKGTEVLTVGFPRVDLQGSESKVTTGVVSSLSGAANDPKSFQISVPVQPGNSGGPLVTHDGAVIGVISSKLNASALSPAEVLPENVNYAVKSSCLTDLLRTLPGKGNFDIKKNAKLKSAKKSKSKKADQEWKTIDLTARVEKTIGLVVTSTEP